MKHPRIQGCRAPGRPAGLLSALLLLLILLPGGCGPAPEDTPVTIPSWSEPAVGSEPSAPQASRASSPASSEPSEASNRFEPPDISKIDVSSPEGNTYTGVCTQLELEVANHSGQMCSYKNTVTVEAYTGDAWTPLPWAEGADLSPTAFVLDDGESNTVTIDLTQLAGGPLTRRGSYRVILPAISDGREGEYTLQFSFSVK